MEIEDLELDDMERKSSSGSQNKRFSIMDENYRERTKTGTYEKIDGERYDLHKDWNRENCSGGTEPTHAVAHIKHDGKRISFWVALCEKHYLRVKNNKELDILSDTRELY